MHGMGRQAAGKVVERLAAPAGLNAQLAELGASQEEPPAGIDAGQMTAQNVAMELAERSRQVRYPAVHIYCEKLVNALREKFRTFSGRAEMTVEVRVSQDRLEGMEETLQTYVDAVTRVLDRNRGDWGDGMFYGGGYEAAFGPVKHGGKNFVQVGKVTFQVEVSR